MNEVFLNGILHLFAIVAAPCQKQHDNVLKLVKNYLTKNLGITNNTTYCELFEELFDLHVGLDDPETSAESAAGIAENLKPELSRFDNYLLLLRLMELTKLLETDSDYQQELLYKIAGKMGFSADIIVALYRLIYQPDKLYMLTADFLCVSADTKAEHQYHTLPTNEFAGTFVVVNIQEINTRFITTISDGINIDETPLKPGSIQVLATGSLIQDHSGHVIYTGDIERAFTEVTQTSTRFTFRGDAVDFRFPNSDNGLHKFTFNEPSGRMIGVMGGSGVGKSTLLSILNGSQQPDSGAITINGLDLYQQKSELEGVIGFVPQDDLLFEDLTVAENLYYSAKLCLDNLPDGEIKQRVNDTLLDLNQIETKDLKVGSPLDKTISGGQRKRLNIALELIREPSILFVDEPTSGLSSSDSENVMSLLKAQAAKGKLVIVIIHQPSSHIYKMFDSLWVLDLGGHPIFVGNPIEAVRYFRESATIAGAEQLFCPQCGHINPEQIFTIIETKTVGDDGKHTRERAYTPKFWHTRYLEELTPKENIVETSSNSPIKEVFTPPDKAVFTPSILGQIKVFLQRNIRTKLSNPSYLAINLLEPPLLALIIGWISRNSSSEGYFYGDNRSMITFFFMSVIVALFMGLSVSAEEIVRDRKILQRESFLNLSWFSYSTSKFLYLLIISAIQMALYTAISIYILKIPDFSVKMFVVLLCCSLFATTLGLNISSAFKSAVSIYILIPILLIPQLLLSGVVISLDDLIPRDSGNVHTPILADTMASRWALEALLVEQYSNNQYQTKLFEVERDLSQAKYISETLAPEIRAKLDFLFLQTEIPNKAEKDLLSRQIVQTALPNLEKMTGMSSKLPKDSYTNSKISAEDRKTIKAYLKKVSRHYYEIGDNLRRQRIDILDSFDKNGGADKIRQENHNSIIEDLVKNRGELDSIRISAGQLVQLNDPIYQQPQSKIGRSVSMAGEKQLGQWIIPTFLFNLGMIMLMTAGLLVALYMRLLQRIMNVF